MPPAFLEGGGGGGGGGQDRARGCHLTAANTFVRFWLIQQVCVCVWGGGGCPLPTHSISGGGGGGGGMYVNFYYKGAIHSERAEGGHGPSPWGRP